MPGSTGVEKRGGNPPSYFMGWRRTLRVIQKSRAALLSDTFALHSPTALGRAALRRSVSDYLSNQTVSQRTTS